MLFNNFRDLVNYLIDLVTLATPVVGGLALLVFFRGLVLFIAKSGDPKSHQDGKNLMIYGIIGLFVMVSFISIIQIAKNVAGTGNTTTLPLIHRSQ